MTEPQTVLIGSSLSDASDAVVGAGLAAARALGASVHLAHAFRPPPWYGEPQLEVLREERFELKGQRQSLERELDAQLERLGTEPAALASRQVRIGPPHRVLDELARDLKPALVAVGAADVEHRHAPVFGSTADRLVRKATRPVLVVRPPLELPPRRVLAPVDLSPLSADALAGALEILRRMTVGAAPEVRALFVLHPDEKSISAQFTPEQIDHLAAEELHRFVERVTGRSGLAAGEEVREGDPRDEIPAVAQAWGADLVVLGTHGRSGFERLVLGSVASYVARHGRTSVLVVPPEAALKAAVGDEAATLGVSTATS